MKEVTLQELKQMARVAYNDLWAGARNMGRDVKLYLHWTGGGYNAKYDDYHINITGDGCVWVSTDNLADIKDATYMRNTGSVAITLCCAIDANSENNLGPCPPTEAQINAMAQVVCVLADALDLTIDLQRVMTHAEAADNRDGIYPHEPYGPDHTVERWDLLVVREGAERWSGGDEMRGNANWYRGQGLLRGE